MFLCRVSSANLAELTGGIAMPGEERNPSLINTLVMVGQSPDCKSYLILTDTEHEYLEKQSRVPVGYDFIFRQEWGLTINEEIINRVIETLRKEAYPPTGEYLDALVKGDLAQEENYLNMCKAVKDKYSKVQYSF